MENYNRVEKNKNGTFYFLDDKFHRLDGPAKEWIDGDKEWYQNGLPYRIDGPAKELANGNKSWWQNGLLHRIDGPAIEFANGDKEWYYEDDYIKCNSQEEFERYIKLRLFW